MPKSETYRLNYYVGAMLAQGGNMWFDETKMVFSPTSAIDRALGASDVEISFSNIQGVEYKGDLMRMFQIKTIDKLHRFHGSQAKRAWEDLAKMLREQGMQPMRKSSSTTASEDRPEAKPKVCSKCSGKIEPTFVFCPFCGTHLATPK